MLTKFFSIFVVLVTTLGIGANAHTQVYAIDKSGGSFSKGKYVIPSNMGNAPVSGDTILTDELRCRSANMDTTGIDSISIDAGSNVTFRYRHASTSMYQNTLVMSRSHVGPCTVYMAPVETKGDGLAWFKIYSKDYDADQKKWCTTEIIDNNGDFEFTIPEDITPGVYYVRTELFAIHQATESAGIQMYPGCGLVNVVGSGSLEPAGYPIPGIYDPSSDALKWTRADDPTKFPAIGAPLYNEDADTQLQSEGLELISEHTS